MARPWAGPAGPCYDAEPLGTNGLIGVAGGWDIVYNPVTTGVKVCARIVDKISKADGMAELMGRDGMDS